jgi:hypothetical protein
VTTLLTTTDHAAATHPPAAADPSVADRAVAQQLLDAIVTFDAGALLELFAEDVWLRALLVREVVETHDAVAALARFHGWFGDLPAVRVLHASTEPTATRHRLTYRLHLRPRWAPDVWHEIEQTGYLRVRDGRVTRLDLACTGFVPLDGPDVSGAAPPTHGEGR